MKKNRSFTIITFMITLVFVGCVDSDPIPHNAISGAYVGTITDIDNAQSKGYLKTEDDAIADITKIGFNLLKVHLYHAELDTIFMVNYYENKDSVNVCFTGNDFESMYGHTLGQGHANGDMMGDIQNNETEWMHHLNDEHQEGDDHYGGIDKLNHTFSYEFTISEGDLTHGFLFQGVKK